MRLVLRSKHTWIGLALLVAFCVSCWFVPVEETLLLTNCLLLAVSCAVALAYLPTVIRAIRMREMPAEPALRCPCCDAVVRPPQRYDLPRIQHITLGILYAWAFSGLWRVWSLLWLAGGQDDWMINNYVVAFLQAGVSLGAFYHLTSKGAVANLGLRHPHARLYFVAAVLLVSLTLTGLLIWLPIDLSLVTRAIKPYIPR